MKSIFYKKLLLGSLMITAFTGLGFYYKASNLDLITKNFETLVTTSHSSKIPQQPNADYEIDAFNGQTVTVCSGNFYDAGGSGSSYSNNENYSMTFCSSNGNPLKLTFTSFDVEANGSCSYDGLTIYNGSNTSASSFGTFCGTNSPGTITSSNNNCLHVVFYSDYSVTEPGWSATISCVSGGGGGGGAEICNNNIDDDGDGDIDCDDSDCLCLDESVCYIISDGSSPDAVYTVDPLTGARTLLGSTGRYSIEAMAIDPVNHILYATDNDDFGTLNIQTGVFTQISTIGSLDGALGSYNIDDIDGLTYDINTGIMWAAERREDNSSDDDLLFQINPLTGQPIYDAFGPNVDYLVIATNEHDLDDLGIRDDGTLFAISNASSSGNQRLVTINTTTGVATEIGDYGIIDVEGMAFTQDNQLIVTTGSNSALYSVDPTTAQSANLTSLSPASDVEGCACRHMIFSNGILGDFVWDDLDGDGQQDPGEPGIAGITIKLLDSSGNPVLDGNGQPRTEVTNSSGEYEFNLLSSGFYILEIVVPNGNLLSPQDAFLDDDIDSDFSSVTNRTGLIDVTFGKIVENVDAGLLTPSIEDCSNGQDDDFDGLTDCNDPDCIPAISNVAVTQPTCPPPSTNGKIIITASGTGTLQYSIDNGTNWQTSNTFSNLGAGQYFIKVRNNFGCEATYTSNPIMMDSPNCIEICNDGIDNDGDGLVDCDDPDCEGVGTGNTIDNQ